jgi:hypothetical protein
MSNEKALLILVWNTFLHLRSDHLRGVPEIKISEAGTNRVPENLLAKTRQSNSNARSQKLMTNITGHPGEQELVPITSGAFTLIGRSRFRMFESLDPK